MEGKTKLTSIAQDLVNLASGGRNRTPRSIGVATPSLPGPLQVGQKGGKTT